MKALLLVAHGSRRQESNQEIRQLAEKLAARAEPGIDLVSCAFLELAEPDIPEGIQRCIDRGATTIQILPYFLARGTHVANDIPEQVAIKQQQHPALDIRISDYLGTADEMVDVLLRLAH